MDELDEAGRWAVLDANTNKPPVKGRAELGRAHFLAEGLTVVPDWDPARHVNIVGWPDDEDQVVQISQQLYACQAFSPRA